MNNNELQTYAAALYDSYRNSANMSLVSEMHPALNLNDAYEIQSLFVNTLMSSGSVSGYKAALTSKKDQEKFAVNMPISGVLFKSGEISNHSKVQLATYNIMLVEVELGYRVAENITTIIKNKEELEDKISKIAPVVELPNVKLESFDGVKLIDVVSTNIFSEKYILGDEYPFTLNNSNNFNLSLSLDGELINDESISDSMAYQMELLMWLINKQLELGREIQAGEILITGAIGKINIGKPGSYLADYGELGRLEFEVIGNR